MNVIDFHVTKILSEKYGKVYELYGMTLEKAQSHPKSSWREYLLSDGVLQEYEFWDYGGTRRERISMSKRTNIPDNKSILQRIEAELAQSSGTEYLLTDGSVISADVEAVRKWFHEYKLVFEFSEE